VELEWTPSALRDIDDAGRYIAQDNPRAAVDMAERVLEAIDYLLQYPALGRPGRFRSTRELVVSGTPFIVVYRVRLDAIQILRVLHHARKWP